MICATDMEEIRYAVFKVGKDKRMTSDYSSVQEWDDYSSFFVYSLDKDKVILWSFVIL